MKKKISKFLSVVLAVIMVFSIVPMSSITASAETTSGSCGENLTWTFDDETGILAIIGSGGMYDYYLNTVPWLKIKSSVQKIVFNGDITYIGSHAFCGFTNITSVDIPDSVTKIGQNAFNGCDYLETVTIPDSVTSLDGYVFADCTNLKEAVFGKGLTETGEHTFSACEGLKSVVIPNNIEVISDSTFWFCTKLESVTITESVKIIGNSAFEHCRSLKSITIPASVKSIGSCAFANCTSLTEISVDKDNEYFCNDEYGVLFNKDKTVLKQYPAGRTDTMYSVLYPVEIIAQEAFAKAQITTVTLPSSLDAINPWAFDTCINLKSIYIKNSIDRIGMYAFYNCYRLSDVYFTGYQYQFEKIGIDANNTYFTNANIHTSYSCEAEHTLTDWIIYDGACGSDEREICYCLYCSEKEVRLTGNIIQHKTTEWEINKEPTCTEQGEKIRYCEKCDNEETRYIDALGHTPADAVEENYVAPTFTETGSKDMVVYCSVCDEELSRETIVVSFTGIKEDHFYKDGERFSAYQLVELDGDFYYIGDRHKIVKNKEVYVKAERLNGLTYEDGTPIASGTYIFDENGKMEILNGIVYDNVYKNNSQLNAYQLVEFDGDFYYIGDRHKIVKNKTVYLKEERIKGLTYADGTPIKAGTYSFDENGKMVILNGVVGNNIYKNNVQLKAYQLVEVDGAFYYIGNRHEIVKDKKVYIKAERLNGLTYEDSTPLQAGWYNFDENGKMIIE